MRTDQLISVLLENRDETYRQMQIRLIPNLCPDRIIGVRTPALRKIARELEDKDAFLSSLPHRSFEENQIHSFLLEREKNFSITVMEVERFLPYVDNWATCDQLRPRCFQKHRRELLPYLQTWILSQKPYTVRFGIEMLMVHFLDKDFEEAYLELPASVHSEEYYVKMMIAWYFATALAKQYEAALLYISGYRLDQWVHNKAIQKAIESNRISPEHKQELVLYRLQ